jgi:predicted nucleic acid-binding protein
MTTRSSNAFVDTNILIRAMTVSAPLHREATELLYAQWDQDIDLWVSRQVIREFMVNLTRPQSFLPTPLSRDEIIERVQVVQTLFRIADDTSEVTARLLELVLSFGTGGKQIHDANIVATMLANDIDTLLTHNVDDFKRYAERIKILPLVAKVP